MNTRLSEKTEHLKTQANAVKSQADALLADLVDRAESLQFEAARDLAIAGGSIKVGALTKVYAAGTAALTEATRRLDGKEGAEPVTEKLRTWTRSLAEAKDSATELGIEGYDALNVRQVAAALPTLTLWQIEQVRRYELAHKNRATVLRACAGRLKLAA